MVNQTVWYSQIQTHRSMKENREIRIRFIQICPTDF